MKKRLLLTAIFGIAGFTAFAQSPVQLEPNRQGIDPMKLPVPAKTEMLGKRQVTGWFNFMVASDIDNGGAIDYTVYGNNPLFPDSTVLQSYGDGAGGLILGAVGRHNIGQMFDPTSFYYDDLLSPFNAYIVDSINFAYRFAHNIPGSVDTLEFQVFYDASVRRGNLVDQNGNVLEPTAWIVYNRTTQKGDGAQLEWRITLSQEDTAWASYKIVPMALPNAVSIASGGLIAVAYRYIPGFDYSPGDTLTHTWDPAPAKMLNQFQPLIGRDNAETKEDSYNHSLTINRSNKYDASSGWATSFIPGDAWIGFSEYTYIGFRISSPNVGLNNINENEVAVYPNPSMGSEVVNIAFTTQNASEISVDIYDLLGNKVQTVLNGSFEAGKQLANVNTGALKAGIYVYTIHAGDQTINGKISIVK